MPPVKSDLFHDVARAYYGVSPELHALSEKHAPNAMPNQTDLFDKAEDKPEDKAPEKKEDKPAAKSKDNKPKKKPAKKAGSKTVNPNFPPPLKQQKSSPGQMDLPFDPEEPVEYGLKDIAKKASLGAGVALSAMGGGCSSPSCDSTPAATSTTSPSGSSGFTDDASKNVQTRLNHARNRAARMKIRDTTGGGPGVGVSVDSNYSLDASSGEMGPSAPEAPMPYALGDARTTGTGEAVPYAIPDAKAKSKRWKRPSGKKGKLPEKNCATACK